MTTETINSELLGYFQHQQTPHGWFDLLTIMVDGMVANVGEQESRPFLTEMGRKMAAAYPLGMCETVGELEDRINGWLSRFNWGVSEIGVTPQGLVIRVRGLPVARGRQQPHEQHRWCNAFCAILEGLLGAWLQAQREIDHARCWRDHVYSLSEVQFRYQG